MFQRPSGLARWPTDDRAHWPTDDRAFLPRRERQLWSRQSSILNCLPCDRFLLAVEWVWVSNELKFKHSHLVILHNMSWASFSCCPLVVLLLFAAFCCRSTVCVSSQVGCAKACQFCMTGKMGLVRNLTAGEILAQVFYARQAVRRHDMVSCKHRACYHLLLKVACTAHAHTLYMSTTCTFISCR